MVVDYMLEDSPIFRLEVDKHGEIILPKEIGPRLETSVFEGIHSFLNIYMGFKYRFAGLWDFGDWVSLRLSWGQKCVFFRPQVLFWTPLDRQGAGNHIIVQTFKKRGKCEKGWFLSEVQF